MNSSKVADNQVHGPLTSVIACPLEDLKPDEEIRVLVQARGRLCKHQETSHQFKKWTKTRGASDCRRNPATRGVAGSGPAKLPPASRSTANSNLNLTFFAVAR